MTIVARGSEIEPGVEIRVIHRKKTLESKSGARSYYRFEVRRLGN